MKGKSKRIIAYSVIAVIVLVAIMLCTFLAKNVNNTSKTLTAENLRAMKYEQVTKAEEDAQNEYVKFLAFFTRDLNGDGYAEKIKGTCKDLSDTDELYIELNVLTDGYLKNGVITLNAENFTWKTAIVSDNIVNGNYIGNTTRVRLQDEIPAGSQKMLWGTISSSIGNNINNYSKPATVTLTGTHVSDDGTETPINKTVNLIVDWYGDVNAEIINTSISKDIKDIKNNNDTVGFTVNLYTKESINKLILKENTITAVIPQLNGYNPSKVTTSGDYNYDEETRTLTATRTSTVNEEGVLTKALARSNTYSIDIEYPKEAYIETANSVSLEIPVTAYYIGYNNSNKEFENPKQSNIAKDVVVISYSEPSGYIYNFNIEVGKRGRKGYTISKEKPLQIYNGITEETVEDYYTVKWGLTRGSQGDVTKVVMKETKEKYTDQFLNTSNNYTDMLNYIENIGIYFTGASKCLGDNGYINVYNDETNELIHKFTKDDWGTYTENNPYKYEVGIKHIRVETSDAKQESNFNVYHIKEINDELLTEEISKQDFDEFSKIYSYLQGSVQISGKSSMDSVNKIGIANYEDKVSYASIGISKSQISTQETQENFEIYINTVANTFNDSKWKNGQFIVKLPSEIIRANINDVQVDNENVQIIGYNVYEENGNYFIKIITENQEEETYKITINCNITPGPATKTSSRNFELYSHNEIAENYYNAVQDIYDANGNNNLQEKVNYSLTNISFITPSTIITSQYVSNYDNEDTITISPNIANVTKEQRTANINVTLLNNYSKTISEVKLIGVIPLEGNSYIVNGKDLGSEFSVQMSSSGIQLPDELKDVVTVYYSENSKPNKELEDSSNGWTKNPSDWTKVKTYLMDFGDFSLPISKSYTFTYEVKIPEGIDYNRVSYSEHAVYFALDTDQGKLLTQTEPNKLGIRIARKYNIEFTKYKEGKDLVVPGATYKLIEMAEDGSEVSSKLGTTNSDGKLQIKDILVGNKYTLKEIKAAENYNLNEDEITFEVIEKLRGYLEVNVLSEDTFASTPVIEKDASGKDVLRANVEDEPKYKVVITKIDKETGEKLKNIKFSLNGVIHKTDENGQITLENLETDKTYTLIEKKADGYYILDEIKFKLTKNAQGNLMIESENTNFSNALIENTDKEHLIKVNVNLTNEKIPTYSLQVLKVEENEENLKPLAGARFKLVNEDLGTQKEYTTDEDGYINISDLYKYVEGKYITGQYTLQETKAPDGYSNNAEKINFKVIKNTDETLSVEIEKQANLTTVKSATINNNTLKIVVQDKPMFKITKIDSETQEKLANAQFTIYELDESGKEVGYAKDVNGNYVGEENKAGDYIVTTDEKGEISVPLRGGTYKIVEVGYPDGYQESSNVQIVKVDENSTDEGEDSNIVKISSIEDLVNLSNDVNAGNNYSGKKIILTKDLDFNDANSYRTGKINESLTTGNGFTPIGNYPNVFSGTFDGQGNEIRNLYINISSSSNVYAGLFGYINNGCINNLGVTGEISSSVNYNNCYSYAGGISGYIKSSRINNCYNTCDVSSYCSELSSQSYAGGIVGEASGEAITNNISNCYNTGEISSNCENRSYRSGAGGIVGYGWSRNNINSCYNIGNISSSSSNAYSRTSAGGIAGELTSNGSNGLSRVSNCYNTGSVSSSDSNNKSSNYYAGSYSGGIVGIGWNSNLSYRYYGISNCYNTGDISSNIKGDVSEDTNSCAGTIIGNADALVTRCYYLDTIDILGETINKEGSSQSRVYMQSEEFYNILNRDKVWIYKKDTYPILLNQILAETTESIEIIINNNKKQFKITTEVGPNSNNERIGGTITGTPTEQDNINFVEDVIYNENSTKEIIMTPAEGYGISNITINRQKIDYIINGDGTYTIPAGYFTNVKENKHIVVTYEPTSQILIINKVDIEDNSKTLKGAKFKIEQIEDEENTGNLYVREFTTNEYGQIRVAVPIGKYKITEIEAPNGYRLNKEPIEFTVEKGKDNTITIENNHLPKLIVHHYLVGTGPENGKEPVVLAEDENYSGEVGENYTTSPRMDLNPYELITDEEGNYIIPSNASGKYTEETTEVTYYYTKAPVTLTVHHYLEGTEEKIAEDEGPTRHEVGTEYETKPSDEVLESYELVNVVGEEKGILTEDTEVIYYYKLKEHVITTRVEIPKEEQEQGRTEKGGKISGEDLKPYETVKHGKDSKEELKMTPDEGYRINKITINKMNGEEVISSEEVIFIPNEDGTYELPKFENVTNDYEIVVQFVKDLGRVIVHHYIEGTEIKIAPNEITQDKIGTIVNTKEVDTSKYNLVEDSERYVLVQAPEERDVTIERKDKEVTYYYQAQYKITTDVIPYDEKQTDGTIKSIKGGEILGEDETPYEHVLKGKDSTKEIKASPDNGFIITGMKINGEVYDYTKKIAKDGTVTLDKFTNMNEDKHIEVQFRRVSNVIVQYILKEPDGSTKLFAEDEIPGYVGKDYETRRINITNYKASTDEEGNLVPSNKDGLMAVDTIYVKYYYEKIPAGITVKHVEKVLKKEKVEVKDEQTGETKEEIKTSFVGEPIEGIEDEYIKGYVGENETAYRKEIERYISSSPIEPSEEIENLINAKQEENQITVTYKENDVIEIVYWYEREYKITTDVKEHEEQVKNTETGKIETISVKGGNITGELTKENTEPVEKVLRGRDSTKEIKIEPDYGYRIKSVTLKSGENEAEKISIKDHIQENGKTAIIPVGYFEYMQADKHIEVEFEKIPAKVIVKYLDVVTKEELLPQKEVDGFVKDPYDEPRVDIDTYIKADPEPENSKGEMTEDTITVIYYYQKQYKITTDVKEHEELEKKPLVDVIVKKEGEDSEENKSENENQNNNLDTNKPENGDNNNTQGGSQSGEKPEQKPEEKKIMVKGGSITGEDEMPYEVVIRGEDNVKVIEMKPDYGYRIKHLTITDGEEVTEIYIDNILTKEGTIIIPEGYFKNMQADKHIVVEYEPIPAKVIVQYLDKETEEKVADSEKGEGFVDYEYKTYPKEIPYYELIEEELPENAEGKLVEKDTIVKYYYKKLPFNMKVEKEISKITLDGKPVEVKDNNKAQVELEGENVNERKLEISYIIKVTNTEKVEGKAIVEEHIPDGFSFVKEKSSKNWEEENGIYVIKTKELKPGESIEYEVTLEWNASKENSGNKVNIAKIPDTENVPRYEETTLEDNEDNATLEIKVKVSMPKTGQARIIYIISGLVIASCITMVIWDRRKDKK